MSQQMLAFYDKEYLSRSWRMLTRMPGWLKPVLLLSLAVFVPIFGPLIAYGYALEWARLTAWGVDSSPKQSGVSLGECLSTGWRGFLVTLVLSIPYVLVMGLIAAFLGKASSAAPVRMAVSLLGTFYGVIMSVGVLRATIYQQFSAGISLSALFEMVEADTMGLLRIAGITIFGGLIVAVVSGVVMTVGSVGAIPAIISISDELTELSASDVYAMGRLFGTLLKALGPALAITALVGSVIGTVFTLLTTNAVGLWLMQFNVPAWGDKDAPLPQRIPSTPPAWEVPAQPVVPASPLMPDQTIRPEQPRPNRPSSE